MEELSKPRVGKPPIILSASLSICFAGTHTSSIGVWASHPLADVAVSSLSIRFGEHTPQALTRGHPTHSPMWPCRLPSRATSVLHLVQSTPCSSTDARVPGPVSSGTYPSSPLPVEPPEPSDWPQPCPPTAARPQPGRQSSSLAAYGLVTYGTRGTAPDTSSGTSPVWSSVDYPTLGPAGPN